MFCLLWLIGSFVVLGEVVYDLWLIVGFGEYILICLSILVNVSVVLFIVLFVMCFCWLIVYLICN